MVPEYAINAKLVIGMDVLNTANYVISNGRVQLTERVDESAVQQNEDHWVRQISIDATDIDRPDRIGGSGEISG